MINFEWHEIDIQNYRFNLYGFNLNMEKKMHQLNWFGLNHSGSYYYWFGSYTPNFCILNVIFQPEINFWFVI